MSRERRHLAELDPSIVAAYALTFVSRDDFYPRQKGNGGYFVVEKPLHAGIITAHLHGVITIGAYALSPSDEAKWLCFDADDTERWNSLIHMAQALMEQGITPYVEPSRRGGHLWLFTPPTPGRDIRRIGKQLLTEHGVAGVELYPKQDYLSTGPGSLVRLPLGIHRKSGRRYAFVTITGEPLAPTIRGQLRLLAHPERLSMAILDTILARILPEQPKPLPRFTRQEIRDGLPSQRIKAAAPLEQFVSQYVKLDARLKGHCPFHDDEHMSFQIGIGKYGAFWHCYADCGRPNGGDIIHFWQRMRQKNGEDDSFTMTITELAGMLLK